MMMMIILSRSLVVMFAEKMLAWLELDAQRRACLRHDLCYCRQCQFSVNMMILMLRERERGEDVREKKTISASVLPLSDAQTWFSRGCSVVVGARLSTQRGGDAGEDALTGMK